MKILPADSKEWLLKIDLLQALTTILVVFLVIFGVIPMWALVLYCLKGFSGITVKVGK